MDVLDDCLKSFKDSNIKLTEKQKEVLRFSANQAELLYRNLTSEVFSGNSIEKSDIFAIIKFIHNTIKLKKINSQPPRIHLLAFRLESLFLFLVKFLLVFHDMLFQIFWLVHDRLLIVLYCLFLVIYLKF